MRAWGLAVVLSFVAACGKGDSGKPKPAPVVAAPDVLARADAIVAAKATRCLIDRLEVGGEALPWITRRVSTPKVTQVAHLAMVATATNDEDRWRAHIEMAADLAMAGDREGATKARDRAKALQPEGAVVIGAKQIALLLGDPPAEDDNIDLDDVPYLVRGGQRDRAEAAFAGDLAPPETTDDPEFDRHRVLGHAHELGMALAALGKHDELRERITGAADKELAAELASGWLDDAAWSGEHLAEAVDAVLARRADHRAFRGGKLDRSLLERAETAIWLGHGAEMAAIVPVLRTAPAQGEPILGWLYPIALRIADDAEVAAVEAALAASTDEPRLKAQLPLMRAAARGTLDELLAAIDAFEGEFRFEVSSYYLAVAWARHVEAGFDPGFEPRLAAATCSRGKGCVGDPRITAKGVEAGDAVLVPPSGASDRAAIAAALKPGIAARCGVHEDNPRLTMTLEPGGSARLALATIRAAHEAGYAYVHVRSHDRTQGCILSPPPKRAPADEDEDEDDEDESTDEEEDEDVDEAVNLSVLLTPDRVWLGQSRIEEYQPFDGTLDGLAEALEEIKRSPFFEHRKDAELAAEDGATTETLATTMWPLCKHFPRLRVLDRDELSAPPTL